MRIYIIFVVGTPTISITTTTTTVVAAAAAAAAIVVAAHGNSPTVLDACHAASVARSAKNSDTNGMNETSQIQSVYLLSVVDAP